MNIDKISYPEKHSLIRSKSLLNNMPQQLKRSSKPPVIKYISKQFLRKTKSSDTERRRNSSTNITTPSTPLTASNTLRQFLNITDVFPKRNKFSPVTSPSSSPRPRRKDFGLRLPDSPIPCNSPSNSPLPQRKKFGSRFGKLSTCGSDTDSSDIAPKVVNRSHSVGNVLDELPKYQMKENTIPSLSEKKWKSLPNLQRRGVKSVIASPLVLGVCSERTINHDETNRQRKHSNKVFLQKKHNFLNPKSDRALTRRRSSQGNEEIQKPLAKFDNKRLENLVSGTLECSTKNMSYDHDMSGLRCRRISKNLEDAVKACLCNGKNLYKVIAQVFMGELKGHGICFATQCTYQFTEDYFATSTFQTDDMFVCAIVTVEQV